MTRIAWSPISIPADALVVLDGTRRLYAGLSRDESYYHLVQPRQFDIEDGDGNVVAKAGELECRCRGFLSHGHCYMAAAAIAFEGEQADQAAAPSWLATRVAPETELEKAAARG